MPGWYELREHLDGVDFQLRTPGGVLLCTSPRLPSAEVAVRRIQALQAVIHEALSIDRRMNERWEPYFGVMSDAGLELAASPVYASPISREHAIDATRMYARTQDVRVISTGAVAGGKVAQPGSH